MIDSGMTSGGATLQTIDMDLVDAAPASSKPLLRVDALAKHALIGVLVVLMLPAMLVVSALALLVPCLLRVPVCGPSPSVRRSTSQR